MFGKKEKPVSVSQEVVVISYFPKRLYEEQIQIAQSGHSIVSQLEIGKHFFRQVSTARLMENGLGYQTRDSMLIASYVLYKEPGSPDYKMYKNRSFFQKDLSFHTLKDFEDLMGMRD